MRQQLSIREALEEGLALLRPDEGARLDCEVILAEVLGRGREYLLTWPERPLSNAQLQDFRVRLARRARGCPVAYITGRRGFWTLNLKVGPGVLIPRPETEILVECALEILPAEAEATVADLGTGSGAIALALASERPHWRLIATDCSAEALLQARENARDAALAAVEFRQGSWCAPLEGEALDAIVCNPPYIREGDRHLEDLRFEPRGALVAGEGGLADIRAIAAQAPEKLRPGGWLLLEHGWDQGAAVRQILRAAAFERVGTRRDLGGHDRVTMGRKRITEG